MIRQALIGLVTLVLIGCGRSTPASPLGTFASSQWAADCEEAIVRENPHDPSVPGPLLRNGGPAFAAAVRRYRCPPPGWAIYTDAADRILGACVDDDTRPFLQGHASFQQSVVREVDRARKLFAAHWGQDLAVGMLQGQTADHCTSVSEPVALGMVRWGASQLSYAHPETIRSQHMCCWEVK